MSEQEEGLVGRLSHDARNPLASVKLALQMLERCSLEERAKRQLSLAMREVRALERLLTAVAESEAVGPFEALPVALDAMVAAAAAECGAELKERCSTVSLSVPEGIAVLAEPRRLSLAIAQLIAEAARARPGQLVTLTVEASERRVALRVSPPPRETLCIRFARGVFDSLELHPDEALALLRGA